MIFAKKLRGRMSDNLKSYVSASPKRMKSSSNEHGEMKEKKESSRGLEDLKIKEEKRASCTTVYWCTFSRSGCVPEPCTDSIDNHQMRVSV